MATELPEKPLSRKESYLAAIAGESVELPEAPESRTEQYLAYIAENGGGGGGGTNNFNQLTNRPKYNGTTMTGSTNIPEVKSYSAGTGLKLTGTAFSVDTTTIQPKLTAGSNVTISGNTISATDTTYSNFTGTDGTAAGTAGLVPAPATTDAGKFLKADGTWDTAGGGGGSYTAGDGIDITNSVISATNTGKARVLTTDDYNWPTNNPDGVALWLLDAGIYYSGSGTYIYSRDGNRSIQDATYIVGIAQSTFVPILILYASGKSYYGVLSKNNGGATYPYSPLLLGSDIIDSLTSTSTTAPLSANQGKVLKDLIDSLAFKNAGAPTTSTVGTVGQLLEDTTNGKLYICTDTTGGSYTWTEVGAGGGSGGITELTSADYNWPENSPTGVAMWLMETGEYYKKSGITIYGDKFTTFSNSGEGYIFNIKPTNNDGLFIYETNGGSGIIYDISNDGAHATASVLKFLDSSNVSQSTGTSQTDVMSQNAVTSMVFADPSTKNKVQIGNGASVPSNSSNGVALGANATLNNANNGVAIGSNSRASAKGEVSFGGQYLVGDGYNNSQYRLLTNVYDGQSAHDAATKGQLDSIAIQNAGAPTTSTVGSVGTLYEDTTNGKLYICTAIVPGTDPDPDTYTWAEVGAGGGSTGITVLSTSDYNYPTDSPTKVALWLLPKGVYYKPDDVSIGGTTANVIGGQGVLTVGDNNAQGYKTVMYIRDEAKSPVQVMQIGSTGGVGSFDNVALAKLSDIYADPSTMYKIKIGAGTSSSEGSNGVEIGHNSQANGVSSVALGNTARALKTNTVAIGEGSIADYTNSVAIGKDATPTRAGEVNIGSGSSQNGFNNSEYRVLGGLYDPQSAHDAATKGYVDPTTDSSAPTTATVGRLGQIFIDTTNADAYMCVAVDSVTPSYTWKKINA